VYVLFIYFVPCACTGKAFRPTISLRLLLYRVVWLRRSREVDSFKLRF